MPTSSIKPVKLSPDAPKIPPPPMLKLKSDVAVGGPAGS